MQINLASGEVFTGSLLKSMNGYYQKNGITVQLKVQEYDQPVEFKVKMLECTKKGLRCSGYIMNARQLNIPVKKGTRQMAYFYFNFMMT